MTRRSTPANKVILTTVTLMVACVLLGLLIAQQSVTADPGRSISQFRTTYEIGTLFQIATVAVAITWARTYLRLPTILGTWAVGTIANTLLTNPLLQVNPWKYGLALPVSVLVLCLAGRRRGWTVLSFTALAAISVIFAHRSWLLILIIGAALLIVLNARNVGSTRLRVLYLVLLSGALALLTFQAAFDGVLGESIQDRTDRQLDWGQGNLILGGRAEWGAAISLAAQNPIGFGIGLSPSSKDWLIALDGLRMPEALRPLSVVAEYMNAGTIEFHSIAWNFWSHYGPAGVALAAWLLVVCFLLSIRLARVPAFAGVRSAAIIFAVAAAWDLLFSPPSFTELGLLVGVFAASFVQERSADLYEAHS